MTDGIIDLDTPLAEEFGFTSDKFDGYLWKKGNYIVISFIISLQERQGNLRKLFSEITDKGYGIKVPTPFARMQKICMDHGFRRTEKLFKEADCMAEVWVKEPQGFTSKEAEK